MRKLIARLGCVLCLLGATTAPTWAQALPRNSQQPGATLLLPYFEVDLANPAGTSTLFSVNNASASAAMANVTLWSDYGVPVFNFNIYLTGYDVQQIDLRSVLQGIIPRTADAGDDPTDTISNKGNLSQDINFPCGFTMPRPNLGSAEVAALQAAFTGSASTLLGGMCATKAAVGNQVARGYVTVDSVTQCSTVMPNDPNYFTNYIADRRNLLYGEYTIVDPTQETAFGDTLVSVVADSFFPPDPELTTAGGYTFYGAQTGWTAADAREPLSTTFAARFIAPKDFKGNATKANRRRYLAPATELIVWRDPKVMVTPFACGTPPAPFPLAHTQILAFDEAENPEALTFVTPPFGKVAQRVALGSDTLPLTTASGWLFLNLNRTSANPSEDVDAAQAWVSVVHRAQQGPNGGRYDAGFRAVRFDGARTAIHKTIP